jgi:hypothetical protein
MRFRANGAASAPAVEMAALPLARRSMPVATSMPASAKAATKRGTSSSVGAWPVCARRVYRETGAGLIEHAAVQAVFAGMWCVAVRWGKALLPLWVFVVLLAGCGTSQRHPRAGLQPDAKVVQREDAICGQAYELIITEAADLHRAKLASPMTRVASVAGLTLETRIDKRAVAALMGLAIPSGRAAIGRNIVVSAFRADERTTAQLIDDGNHDRAASSSLLQADNAIHARDAGRAAPYGFRICLNNGSGVRQAPAPLTESSALRSTMFRLYGSLLIDFSSFNDDLSGCDVNY